MDPDDSIPTRTETWEEALVLVEGHIHVYSVHHRLPSMGSVLRLPRPDHCLVAGSFLQYAPQLSQLQTTCAVVKRRSVLGRVFTKSG